MPETHMPGPWRVIDAPGMPFVAQATGTADAHCIAICEAPGWAKDEASKKKYLANAYLIAAAPDLLEACENVCRTHLDDNAITTDRIEALLQAQAAIAKAKGTP